jgi:UDP-N-acetylmuramate dehydrogenase
MKISTNVSLKEHSTFGIGGIAPLFYEPETRGELIDLVKNLNRQKTKFRLLGNGSNLLLTGRKIKNPIISTRQALSNFEISESGRVSAEAGVDIRKLINACVKRGLRAPVELLTIPATLGGAIYMNAGRTSYKVWISDHLVRVHVFDGFEAKSFNPEECRFGYRYSIFHENKNLIILGADFEYPATSKEAIIRERSETLKAGADKCYRTAKSAGSVFKKFDEKIMFSLRGFHIGDAVFAPNTTNCILNKGNAKAWQVYTLITVAKFFHKVKKKKCELEIEIW